jgi:glycosyltransferase involved in cell wall biosynthesis
MKYLHIVPGANDVANGMARVARLLAKEQGDAEVVDLSAVSGQSLAVSEGSESLGLVESLEEVWVHGMWLPKEWAICRRVIKAGKRLVRMTHGSLSPVYLKNQSPIKKWLVGPIERYWLRKADRIVATCDAEKAWIEAYLGKKCPEIVVEDVKRFFKLGVRSQELGVRGQELGDRCLTHKKLNVLYLGRRHPLKGVEFLEAAVAELNAGSRSRESKSDSGIGNFSNVEGLSAHCSTSTSNFDSRQIELKIVSDAFGEEKEKVWDWCDVLVLPTLSENFGLVVAEALERGKRVITTDGAPAWEEMGKREVGKGKGEEGSGKREDGGERLIYLRGFRDGSDEERVRLLKDALMMMV